MFMPRSLLGVLADPSVTYLLFVLGIIGLVGEVHHPGTLLPGIAGGLAMVLALVGFSELGINWIGLGLVLLATALFVAEAHRPGFGLLAVAGILGFVVGSWLLFVPLPGLLPVSPVSPGPSSRAVSPWLIALSAFAISGYFLIVLRAALRLRRLPAVTGAEALLGQEGMAISDLTLRGTVRVAGEDWSAIADVGSIRAGETVEVIGVEGIVLRVHRPYEWRLPSQQPHG
jgi:membrane-bound serine protease (ClpP class)